MSQPPSPPPNPPGNQAPPPTQGGQSQPPPQQSAPPPGPVDHLHIAQLAAAAAQQAAQAAQQSANVASMLVNQSAQPEQPPASSNQAPPREMPATDEPNTSAPPADVYNAPDAVYVYIDLPGVRGEDVRLAGNNRHLQVLAERPSPANQQELAPIQQERPIRAERELELPVSVDIDRAEANCVDGVCTVRLPKLDNHPIGVQ